MSIEQEQVVKWMKALIDSVAELSALAAEFRELSGVKKVYNDLGIHRMIEPFGVATTYYGFEYYVDVFLHNGNAICWHMDVSWDEEKWIIETNVSIPGDYGSETIQEFPDRFAHTVEEFIEELQAATKQLIEHAGLIDSQRK